LALSKYARQRAVIESKIYSLRFHTNSRQWISLQQEKINSLDSVLLKTLYLPSDIKINPSVKFIYFYPDGKIDSALISLSSNNGKTYQISYEGIQGRMVIKK
jgi:hypothetical protein